MAHMKISIDIDAPVPPFAQLYQFNVQVPAGLLTGDHAVVVNLSGVASPSGTSCCFITVE